MSEFYTYVMQAVGIKRGGGSSLMRICRDETIDEAGLDLFAQFNAYWASKKISCQFTVWSPDSDTIVDAAVLSIRRRSCLLLGWSPAEIVNCVQHPRAS